jgi:hypothetical protein
MVLRLASPRAETVSPLAVAGKLVVELAGCVAGPSLAVFLLAPRVALRAADIRTQSPGTVAPDTDTSVCDPPAVCWFSF